MNLADIGMHWARWQPDQAAISFRGSTITWREQELRSDELADVLQAHGIVRGDRIALLMLNRPEWCLLSIAAWKIGAVIVPLNIRFTPAEVAFVVSDSGAKLLITDPALRAGAAGVGDATVVLIDEFTASTKPGVHPRTDTRPDVDDLTDAPSFLCYTSGTTGDPKGAVLTHRSWNAASQGWAQAIELTPSDRVALPFPLAFTGGLAVWLFTYWAGARLVLEPSVDTDRLFDLFETERVTALLAVPLIHQQLVDHPRFATADLSSWRVACSGGAPVPVPLLKAIQARGIPMLQAFSLTEVSAAATMLPAAMALSKVGSAGLPVLHGDIAIAHDDGDRCGVGEVGEILVRGPQVMHSYWNNPAATAQTLRDGWLHTGDLGYLDADGYLFVVDRKKDMLITGGLNVYPAELERALAALPGVTELAVIGVEDAKWGEVPVVVAVCPGEPVTGEAVLANCRSTLADFKLPRYLAVRTDPLPRNMSGKVLKRSLKEEYARIATTHPPIR